MSCKYEYFARLIIVLGARQLKADEGSYLYNVQTNLNIVLEELSIVLYFKSTIAPTLLRLLRALLGLLRAMPLRAPASPL